ncbi:MAG TPA: FAD-binding protein [Candidatus Dormibacteraeota bacterium]|nr:FAD-binding protein [Candidatus Dormibacteraeota bacterium]
MTNSHSQIHPRVDVLVIGDGLAGTAAALAAAATGAEVLLTGAAAGSSVLAQGGIAAAIGPGDSPGLHAADTLRAGAGLCDQIAVVELTRWGPSLIRWLEDQGVEFDAPLGLEAAHSLARVVHGGGDASGRTIMAALGRAVGRNQLIQRWRGAKLDQLLGEGECLGAAFERGNQRWLVPAAATILATGGYAGLWARTTNARVTSGEGILAAAELGAEVDGMEFVQFHPTAFAGPGRPFLLTEALRGAGAHVVDRWGRRFLFAYDARGELAPRDIVSRAIAEHLRRVGGSTAFLSAAPIPRGTLIDHFPTFVRNCAAVGLDPTNDLIPIAPAAHYSIGGVVTDLEGSTSVPRLWAAGECAYTGVHGANRLASNSLLEAGVFGRRAGLAAAGAGARFPEPENLAGGREPKRDRQVPARGPILSIRQIRSLMTEHVGVLRSESGLRFAVELMKAAAVQDDVSARALALGAMVAAAALARPETAGAHVRIDAETALAG